MVLEGWFGGFFGGLVILGGEVWGVGGGEEVGGIEKGSLGIVMIGPESG